MACHVELTTDVCPMRADVEQMWSECERMLTECGADAVQMRGECGANAVRMRCECVQMRCGCGAQDLIEFD